MLDTLDTLDTLDAPVDLAYVRQVNGKVGVGIITIPAEHKVRFEGLLFDFYKSSDPMQFLSFVADVGVDGIEVSRSAPSGQ